MRTPSLLRLVCLSVILLEMFAVSAPPAWAQPGPPLSIPDPNVSISPGGSSMPEEKQGPRAPDVSIGIPLLQFTNAVIGRAQGGAEAIDIPWIAQYMSAVYRYAVGIGGMLAAVMMMIGGVQYLTAGGDSSRVARGKQRITDALLGLMIVMGAYLLMYVVNPDLVGFGPLRVVKLSSADFETPTGIPEELLVPPVSTNPAIASPPSTPARARSGRLVQFCGSRTPSDRDCKITCMRWGCGTNPNESNCGGSSYPRMTDGGDGIIDPNSPELIPVSRWPAMKNVTVAGGVKATQDVIDGLKRLDAHLDSAYAGQGLTIKVGNCWRDWRGDAAKECAYVLGQHSVKKDGPIDNNPNDYGLAWPGASPHSAGVACDLKLFKNGKQIAGGRGLQVCDSQRANVQLFVDIVTNSAVGAKRLMFESWHFEWGPRGDCRCIGAACAPIWPMEIPVCGPYPKRNTKC